MSRQHEHRGGMSGLLPIVRPTADTVLLFDPETGEQVDLVAAPVALLATLRDLIREAESDQRVAKQALDAELHRRMDFESTLTLRDGGWTITGRPDTASDWDVPRLEKELERLVDEGDLSPDAALRALKPVRELKPMAGELKKLAARFPGIADCRVEVPQQRRATVKRNEAA